MVDTFSDSVSSQNETKMLSPYDLDYFSQATKFLESSLSKLGDDQKIPPLQKRQEMRIRLEEIDQKIASLLGSNINSDVGGTRYIGLWMALENQISAKYQIIFRNYLIDIRKAVADLQAIDAYKPTKYNDKIIALDALIGADSVISFPILHNQIVHFLIELYHICKNDERSMSLLEWIKDYIAVLGILPRFTGINIEDHIGNYPLNRVLHYQNELDVLSGNDVDLKRKNEAPQRKLKELVSVLMNSGAEVCYTKEQKIIAAEIDREIQIEKEKEAIAVGKELASIYTQYGQPSVLSRVLRIIENDTKA